jgi:hypothetical protein
MICPLKFAPMLYEKACADRVLSHGSTSTWDAWPVRQSVYSRGPADMCKCTLGQQLYYLRAASLPRQFEGMPPGGKEGRCWVPGLVLG